MVLAKEEISLWGPGELMTGTFAADGFVSLLSPRLGAGAGMATRTMPATMPSVLCWGQTWLIGLGIVAVAWILLQRKVLWLVATSVSETV